MRDNFLQFMGLTKRAGNLLEGYNRCEDVIDRGKISLLILADDCSENTKAKFLRTCENMKIPVIQGYSGVDLACALGVESISVVGIINKKMSAKLMELWQERNKI